MKKISSFIILCIICISLFIPVFDANVSASGSKVLPFNNVNYTGYKGVIDNDSYVEGASSKEQLNLFVDRAWDAVRIMVYGVALFYALMQCLKMIVSRGEIDSFNKARSGLTYGIIGLILMALGEDLVQLFSVDNGTFIKNQQTMMQTIIQFDKKVGFFSSFLKWIAGGLALIFTMINGFKLITANGKPDDFKKVKNRLVFGSVGLIVLIISDTLVNDIFFVRDLSVGSASEKANIAINFAAGSSELIGLTKFLAHFAMPASVLTLVAAGILYIVSVGNDDLQKTAKRIMLYTVVGMVLIYGAFAIVSTFISGNIG